MAGFLIPAFIQSPHVAWVNRRCRQGRSTHGVDAKVGAANNEKQTIRSKEARVFGARSLGILPSFVSFRTALLEQWARWDGSHTTGLAASGAGFWAPAPLAKEEGWRLTTAKEGAPQRLPNKRCRPIRWCQPGELSQQAPLCLPCQLF